MFFVLNTSRKNNTDVIMNFFKITTGYFLSSNIRMVFVRTLSEHVKIFLVALRNLFNNIFWDGRNFFFVRVALRFNPIANLIFIKFFGALPFFHSLGVTVTNPVTAAVAGMKFINKNNLSVRSLSKFVFGIYKNKTGGISNTLSIFKQFHSAVKNIITVSLSHVSFCNNIIRGDWFIFYILGSGSKNRTFQFLMLNKAFRENVPAVISGTILVMGPKTGAGRTSNVTANNNFDFKRDTFFHNCVFAGAVEMMVRYNITGFIKPPCAHIIEKMSFMGNFANVAVKCACAVGGFKKQAIKSNVVYIANLSTINLSGHIINM